MNPIEAKPGSSDLEQAEFRFAECAGRELGGLCWPDMYALADEIEKASHSPGTTTGVYLRGLIAAAGKLWGQKAIDCAEEIVRIAREPREA